MTNWDLEEDGVIRLDGEWEFYWEQLLEPVDFTNGPSPKMTGFINVPSVWNKYKVNKAKLGGDGYTTYRLIININDSYANYGLKIPYQYQCYQLWLNGKIIASNGVVGKTRHTTIPQYFPRSSFFHTDEKAIELIVQVANFHSRKGGIGNFILLGTENQIKRMEKNAVAIDLFLTGSILIMAFYHFGLFLLRKKDSSTLFFGIFCVLVATRIISDGGTFLAHLFPGIGWVLLMKLSYLPLYLALPTFSAFLYVLFPHSMRKVLARAILILGGLFSLIVLVTAPSFFTRMTSTFEI